MSAEAQPGLELPGAETTAPKTSNNANASTTLPNDDTPLGKLIARLADIISRAKHNEMYGVELTTPEPGADLPIPTQVILQKFLRANANDVDKAATQLEKALSWRKSYQPNLAADEIYDKTRFSGLGYVVSLTDVPGSPNAKDVAAFNIYGAVKDNKKTFGDLDGFIRWRVALQELTVRQLDLAHASVPIPSYGQGPDPYLAYQVHDYLSVSFLRQAPEVKAASAKTIQLFSDMYPETVSRKFFVNVPLVMQWMMTAMKMVLPAETVAKMKWMSYGSELYRDLGRGVARVYGGTGPDLEEGVTPRYSA